MNTDIGHDCNISTSRIMKTIKALKKRTIFCGILLSVITFFTYKNVSSIKPARAITESQGYKLKEVKNEILQKHMGFAKIVETYNKKEKNFALSNRNGPIAVQGNLYKQVDNIQNGAGGAKQENQNDEFQIKNAYIKNVQPDLHRLVHLDLKGAPPKVSYLQKIFPLFQKWGATGLLIEYEDMFPYSGNLSVLARKYAYSSEEISKILALAKEYNLMVMPLVQTFGHLEFVLKHEQFAHLREDPKAFDTIIACPCNNTSLEVLKQMISQVMVAHPDISYFHIGSDEVWKLGKGEACTYYMEKEYITKKELFLQHVTAVAGFIREKHPNITPIMWDDMFRKADLSIVQASGIGNLVEPMVWKYTLDIEEIFPQEFWLNYAHIFKNVWVASAFKGATGSAKFVADNRHYVLNNLKWSKIIKNNEQVLNFRGIALTGWTRYNHLIEYCEILPVAIPSVAYCLQGLLYGEISDTIIEDISKLNLGCNQLINPNIWLVQFAYEISHAHCTFPGSDVYQHTFVLRTLLAMQQSPQAAKLRKQSNLSLADVQNQLKDLREVLRTNLKNYFDIDTVNEWISQYFPKVLAKTHVQQGRM